MGGKKKSVRQKLNIVKLPGNYDFDFKYPNWHDMPILYLELLENKNKVKPELRNTDFVPTGIDINSFPNFSQERITASQEMRRDVYEEETQVQSQSHSNSTNVNSITIHNDERPLFEQPQPQSSSIGGSVASSVSASIGGAISLNSALSQHPPPSIQFNHPSQPQPQYQPQSQPQLQPQQQSESFQPQSQLQSNSTLDYEEESSSSIEENSGILNILRGDQQSQMQNQSSIQHSYFNSTPSKNQPQLIQQQQLQQFQQPAQKMYPSLSDIQTGNVRTNRDLTFLGKNDEKDIQRKRELLNRFKTLKRHYSDVSIPEYTEYSDLQTMEREYDSIVRQLRIDSNVENYKKYLFIGFSLIEFLLTKYLKFVEISGFTEQQLLCMNQYEKILLEIGEKHQIEPSKQWGPEVRLMSIIAMNAVIFVGTKMLFKAGSNMDILKMFNPSQPKPQSPPPQNSNQSSQSYTNNTSGATTGGAKSSSMRGPSIDIDKL